MTKARITQLLDLTLLAPDLQEAVLTMEAVDGVEPMSERALRVVAATPLWSEQRRGWMGTVHFLDSNRTVPSSARGP